MSSTIKYIGLDVHKEAITIAVRNGTGKLIMGAPAKPARSRWCKSTTLKE